MVILLTPALAALAALSPAAPCPMIRPDALTRNGDNFIPGLCGLLMFNPDQNQTNK